ncbi:putative endonuclease-reverse transcriptase [Trichonephila clavipes]|nr:putative endonuclease-reverse transcriptase [Trichonephila clavipes]
MVDFQLLDNATTTNIPFNFDYLCDFVDIFDDKPACVWCIFNIKNCRNGIDETKIALVKNTVGDYQNGFRKGRSTTEQIFSIRQVLQKTREFGIDTHHLFIDFKTAYDSINRKALIAAMKEFQFPDKLLRLISLTFSETKIVVKMQNDLSDPLKIKNGVRQGDVLLFSIALEKVVTFSNINARGNIFNKSIQFLAFADDIDIITRTPTALRRDLLIFRERSPQDGTENQ